MRPLLLDHMSSNKGGLLDKGRAGGQGKGRTSGLSERKESKGDIVNIGRKRTDIIVDDSPTKQLRVNWGGKSGVGLVPSADR